MGGIGLATMTPNIVGGRVYKLTASMKNNLSCTYYNVGRYYDRSSGRSYAIDMKAVVTDFTKKPKGTEDVRNAIADGALDDTGGPLFCFIGGKSVGSIGVSDQFLRCSDSPVFFLYSWYADTDSGQGIYQIPGCGMRSRELSFQKKQTTFMRSTQPINIWDTAKGCINRVTRRIFIL